MMRPSQLEHCSMSCTIIGWLSLSTFTPELQDVLIWEKDDNVPPRMTVWLMHYLVLQVFVLKVEFDHFCVSGIEL